MIQLKDVSKFYSANGITNVGIQNINLTLTKGEIVAITGESGSGKSTLLNVLTKIDTFDEGEIYYKGNPTSYFNISDMDDFRKNKVGFIFQNYNILDSYTVLDNVKLPLLLKGVEDAEAEKQAVNLLEKVGLSKKLKSRGSKLSGGEKQRCVIARALASDCEILACDEPTGNLDSETAKEIINLISEIAEDKLVLIVTHNFSEVEGIATRRLKVSDGRIVEDIALKDINLPEDENEEIDLDYKPIPKKICAKIALSNVKFTPKKTTLVAIIFFVISFVAFILLQVVNSSIMNSYYDNSYNNFMPNIMHVYDEEAEKIDVSLLDGYEYEVNSYSYELGNSFTIKKDKDDYYDIGGYVYYLNNFIDDYELIEGNMPENEDEVVIFEEVDDSLYGYYWSTCDVGNYIKCEGVDGDQYFKVVGICGYTDNYSYTNFVSGGEKFTRYCNNSSVSYLLTIELNETQSTLQAQLSTNKDTALYVDSSYKNEGLSLKQCMIEGIYSMDVNNINIVYVDNLEEEFLFVINPLDDLKIDSYFATINVDQSKAKIVKKVLQAKGLKVTYPYEDGEESMMKLIGKVLSFVINLELSTYLIGIFFITYIILSKIFASRVKDYEILRTLGVTKRDMKRIVNYEVLSLGFASAILALATSYILIYTIKGLKFMREFSIVTLILYVLVMSLFIIFMAKRFNKKLFKFSVRKSFEGEEDD